METVSLYIRLLLPIGLGVLLAQTKLFSRDDVSAIKRFAVRVGVPFLAFRNIAGADSSMLQQVPTMMLANISISIAYFFVAVAASRLVTTVAHRRAVGFGILSGNYGFLGWGVVAAFYGHAGLTLAVFFGVLFWPTFLLLGFLFVALEQQGKIVWREFLEILARNGAVILTTTLSALAWKSSGVPIPKLVIDVSDVFAPVVIPLILFTIGFDVSLRVSLRRLRLILFPVVVRTMAGMVIGFAVAAILASVFGADPLVKKVIMMLAIMPTGVLTTLFGEFIEMDRRLLSEVVTVSTLVSLVTIPLWHLVLDLLC